MNKEKNLYKMFIYSYKQRKFNLFREESEGYSKLVVELNQERPENEVASILEIVKSLIGKTFRSDTYLESYTSW